VPSWHHTSERIDAYRPALEHPRRRGGDGARGAGESV